MTHAVRNPILLVLCSFVGVLCPANLAGQANAANSQNQPTPVQPGTMSANEREHSKLYQYETGIREDLDVKTRNSGQDVTLKPFPPARFLSPTPMTLEEVLTKKVCGPDAVIVGSVQSRTSQLTENRKWVFSELSVLVDQVVKDNPQASIGKGDTVLITRSGGTILLNKKKVDVQPPGGHLRGGVSYLFFLKYLPETNSYDVDDLDILQVRDQTLSQLPNIEDKTFDSIPLSQLTVFASTSCAKATGPGAPAFDSRFGSQSVDAPSFVRRGGKGGN